MMPDNFIHIKLPAASELLIPDTEEGVALALDVFSKAFVVHSFYDGFAKHRPDGINLARVSLTLETPAEAKARTDALLQVASHA